MNKNSMPHSRGEGIEKILQDEIAQQIANLIRNM